MSTDRSSEATQREALLTTKLHRPASHQNLVPRPRLIERLNKGLAGGAVLVSAPAGFGKTTLLTEWLAACPYHSAWLSLDDGDNDPVRFLRYTIAALKPYAPATAEATQGLLQASPAIETVLTALINGLAALPDDLVLVLDDYHVIANPRVHQALPFLIDHLPGRLRLVIATRADPPLPLARWRARGQLIEIRADDLRFEVDEAERFLNTAMGLSLPEEDVTALQGRTEGWIVGLQMAALSMQGRTDISAFVKSFSGSHHYILDYLVEEVLDRQPEDVQNFLLHTSVLNRLTGPLCDALTGRADGQATLENLERANLFVVRLDDERRWFRYHHLFADLLRARLSQSSPELAAILHSRAAEWHVDNGLAAAAVDHALAAGDVQRAAELVEQNAPAVLRDGAYFTILNWLKAVPEETVRQRPWLCIYYATGLGVTGEVDRAEEVLQHTERLVEAAAPTAETRTLLGQIAAIRAVDADSAGDPVRAIEYGRQADEYLPADDHETRASLLSILGHSYCLEGDLARAAAALGTSRELCEATGHLYGISYTFSQLAKILRVEGKLREALDLYRHGKELVGERAGRASPLVAPLDSGISDVLREQNDLDHAYHHAKQGVENGEKFPIHTTLVFAYTVLANVLLAKCDLKGAGEQLRRAKQVVATGAVYQDAADGAAVAGIRILLARGDVLAATRWIEDRRLSPDDELRFGTELDHIMLARVLVAQGQAATAAILLARLAEAAENAGRIGRLIEILALEALALQDQGKTDQALVALGRSLSYAAPEGYARTYLDEGQPMAALLRRGLANGGWRSAQLAAYTGQLLTSFGGTDPGALAKGTPKYSGQGALAEPLTDRELEVLNLLAAGLSNQEIMEKLVVARGTVKAHVHHICEKLDAQSRSQAVARARQLGLL